MKLICNLLLTIALCAIHPISHAQLYEFQDKLVPLPFLDTDDHLGEFDGVAIDGDYAVVGASTSDIALNNAGLAFLYKWNEYLCFWELKDTITAHKDIDIQDLDEFSEFGYSVDLKNGVIVIGAPGYNTGSEVGGRVYVYQILSDEAVFVQRIQAWYNDETDDTQNGDRFGTDIAWDGQNLIVSAIGETRGESMSPSITNSGAAYIYNWNAGMFNFKTKVYAPNRSAGDLFGFSVAIYGNFALVGAIFEDENSDELDTKPNAGSVYIFDYNLGVDEWLFFQKIVAPDRDINDNFGCSVDINQTQVIVGAMNEDENHSGTGTLNNAGSVYSYKFITNFTIDQKISASDRAMNDHFGAEVKIYDNTILVGAPTKDLGGYNQAGQAYTFTKDGTWTESQIFTANVITDVGMFGEAIDINFNQLIIGEPFGSLDENDDPIILERVGAAYIYDIPQKPILDTIYTDLVGYCSEITDITFEVSGILNDAYDWEWYKDSCGGEVVGTGELITLEILEPTTICVRAIECYDYVEEEDCQCVYVDIKNDHWHQKTNYGLSEIPSGVITDAEGNIYTTGTYQSFAEFNGGDNSNVFVDDLVLDSIYASNIFISKYDNCGNLLWVSYSVGNEFNEFSNGITLKESEGEVYIAGEYNESITIMNGQGDEGFGSGSLTLSSSPGTRGGFVAQLNRDDGKINFIEHVGSALSKNRLTEITINENNGDIYVAGQTYDIESETRVFIRKYKPSLLGLASHHWEQISNPGTKAIINGMDYDGASPTIEDMGSLWFTGTFRESFRFSFDALLTTSAQSDAFVGKFSEYYAGSGDYVVRNFVKKGNVIPLPTYEMEGNDIDTDPATGNAYITGNITGETFDAFEMPGENLPLTGLTQVGYFVAMRYDGGVPTGNLSEITYPAPSVYGTGISVAVKNDKVYFTGTRNDDVKFTFTDPILPHTGFAGHHLYIVAYDLSTGNYVWANGTQNPSIDVTSNHYPFAITTNHEGHAYIVGNFWSKMGYIDGTPSSGNLTYTSNGGSLFIMRIDIEGDGEKALESTLSDDITEINQEQIQFNRDLRIENSSDIKNNILLYPNPTNGQTFLKIVLDNTSHYEIFIHSLDGKLILQQNGVIGTNEFNTSSFETGIYIISLIGENLNHQLTFIKN